MPDAVINSSSCLHCACLGNLHSNCQLIQSVGIGGATLINVLLTVGFGY